MIALLQDRPPYIRFEIGAQEYRDPDGSSQSRDVEHILVTSPGTKDVHVALADEWIKQKEELARRNPPEYNPEWATRFRAQYKMWKEGVAIPEYGVPIRTWPALSPSEVKRCLEANILTVEDLGGANEQAMARLGMGARALKAKALTWLADKDGAKAAEQITALQIQNADLATKMAEMADTIAGLQAVAAANEGSKKGRRKPEPDDGDMIK